MSELEQDFETVQDGLENPLCYEVGDISGVRHRRHEAGPALDSLARIQARLARCEAALRMLALAHAEQPHVVDYVRLGMAAQDALRELEGGDAPSLDLP